MELIGGIHPQIGCRHSCVGTRLGTLCEAVHAGERGGGASRALVSLRRELQLLTHPRSVSFPRHEH